MYSAYFSLFYFLIFKLISVVAKYPCDPDSFQIIEAHDNLKPYQPYLFRVANREEMGCAINVFYKWEVFWRVNAKEIYLQPSVLLIKDYTRSRYNVIDFTTVSKEKDIFGNSYILRISLIPRPTHFRSYRIHIFTIADEDYNFEIAGGKNRTHYIGQGSLLLKISAKRETGRPIKYRPKSILWSCIPGWGFKWIPKTTYWEINEKNLIRNRVHHCTVNATLPNGRSLFAEQMVTIKQEDESSPVLEIICIENCQNASSWQNTKLQAICHKNCNGTPAWTVSPFDSNIFQKLKIFTNGTLLIPPGTFHPSLHYTIMATLGTTIANYTVNYRIEDGKLEVTCVENCFIRSKQIVLKVACTGSCIATNYWWIVQTYPDYMDWTHFRYSSQDDKIYFPPFSFYPKSGALIMVLSIQMFISTFYSFNVNTTWPTIHIQCETPCLGANAALDLTLTADCSMNCEDITSYFWSFSPSQTKYDWFNHASDNYKKVTIPGYTYQPNDVINVTMYTLGVEVLKVQTVVYAAEPRLEIICISGCKVFPKYFLIDVSASSTFVVQCFGPCEGIIYTWMHDEWDEVSSTPVKNTTIKIGEIYLVDNKKQVFFPPNYFNRTYQLQLMLTVKGSGKSEAFVIIKSDLQPEIKLLCEINCLNPADPDREVIFRVICKQSCTQFTYFWTLSPIHHQNLWYDKIELSENNETLKILKKSFKTNDNVTVVIHTNPFNYTDYYDLHFRSIPHLKLQCLLNCNPTWSHKATVLMSECMDCYESVTKWDIMPHNNHVIDSPKKDLVTSQNGSQLTVAKNTFPGERIKFTASRSGAMVSLYLQFIILDMRRSLRCSPTPCIFVQNRQKENKIIFEIAGNSSDLILQWSINPVPNHFSWVSKVRQGYLNFSLIISPKAFPHDYLTNVTVTMVHEDIETTAELRFWDPQPDFHIECMTNCNHSDPYRPVNVKIICDWQCEYVDIYKWELEPPPKNFKFDIKLTPKHREMTIQNGVYKDGDVIVVTASWSIYIRTLKISFVEPVPQLEIECLRNCNFNVILETVFQVICKAFCTPPDIFKWTVDKGIKETNVLSDGRILLIEPQSYPVNVLVNLKVCKGKGCTTKVFSFVTPQYVLKVSCISNCNDNVPVQANPILSTVFLASCLKECSPTMTYTWKFDQEPYPLRYGVDLKFDIANQVKVAANVFSNDSCVQVFAESGGIVAGLQVCFFQPLPSLLIVCLTNCGYSEPSRDVNFKLICLQNCRKLIFEWKLEPKPSALYVKGKTAYIRKNMFQDMESAMILVISYSIVLRRHITFATNPPKIGITCKPSCNNVNPKTNVILKTFCKSNCSDQMDYRWVLSPLPKTFIWSLDVTLSSDNGSLMIHSNVFENNSFVYATVYTKKEAFVSAKITYLQQALNLSIECIKNCMYNPSIVVVIGVWCRGCDDLKKIPNCTLTPKINHSLTYSTVSSLTITIPENTYTGGTHVTLNCIIADIAKQMSFDYAFTAHGTKCALKPKSGISGITSHIIECKEFARRTSFHIYQIIPGMEEGLGMLLSYGQKPFIPSIYFGPTTNSSIGINIKVKGKDKKLITFKVESIPYIVITNNSMFRQGSDEFYAVRVIYEQFQKHLKFSHLRMTMQYAYILEDALSSSTEHRHLNIRRDVLSRIMDIASMFYAEQLLLFIEIIMFGKVIDLDLLVQCVNVEYRIIKSLYQFKISHDRSSNILRLAFVDVGLILNRAYIFARPLILNKTITENGMSFEASPGYEHTTGEINLLLHKITLRLILIVDKVMSNRRSNKNETFSFNHVSVATVKLSPTDHGEFKVQLKGWESYILVNLHLLFWRSQRNVTFHLAGFKPNLFWWDQNVKNVMAEFLIATAIFEKNVLYNYPWHVFIKLLHAKIYQNFNGSLEKNETLIWTVYSPHPYSLHLSLGGENVTFIFTYHRPTHSFVSEKGYHVIQDWGTSSYVLDPTKVHYLALIGSGFYSFNLLAMRCLLWYERHNIWAHNACTIPMNQPKGDYVACHCERLGVITAETEHVSVERSKFTDKTFEEELVKKSKMLNNISIIVFAMFVALIIAICCDKKLKKVQNYQYLSDNYATDKNVYIIIVQTSMRQNAGTTATVSIQLFGSKHNSRVHLLNFDNKHVLQRNCTDYFVVLTPAPLGTIKHIRLWHNMDGSSPDWFCNAVIVKHATKRKQYTFIPYRWFSLHSLPFTVQGLFKPEKKNSKPLRRLTAKLETGIRSNTSFLPIFCERRHEQSIMSNVIITITSILVMMSTLLLLKNQNESNLSLFIDIVIAVVSGLIVSTVFGVIVSRTRGT